MGRAYRRAQLINAFANTPQVDRFPSVTPMGWWLDVRRVLRTLQKTGGFKDFITDVNERASDLPTFVIPVATGITLPRDIIELSGRFSPFSPPYLSFHD